MTSNIYCVTLSQLAVTYPLNDTSLLYRYIESTLYKLSISNLCKTLYMFILPRKLSSEIDTTTNNGEVPSSSQVVICGGGVIGCSIAYHLAKCGWNDVVLLEQGRCG